MNNIANVRQTIFNKLTRVHELGNGVIRGERTYDGKTFATAYIDLSDHVIERANELTTFQEELLGNDFFKDEGEQRWNSYLYFWAGPNSRSHENFLKAKFRIESDRHFARKFVLTEEEILERLEDVAVRAPNAFITTDASVKWEEILRTSALGILLQKRPRTQLLELIASGEAFVAESVAPNRSTRATTVDPLTTGLLRHFHVGTFRPKLSNKDFQFGDVNLIFGQNGAGKTSLLEAIEALYCGRIRRDPQAYCDNISAEVLMPNGETVPVQSTTVAAPLKARNLAWYGRYNHLSEDITEAFTRFNFLDTDAAFRLSSDTTPEQIKKDLSLLLVGAQTSALWTDLCKLRDDAISKQAGQSERIPILLKQTEFLGNEVKRLQELPSEATTYIKSFYGYLRELGCIWRQLDDTGSIFPTDRAELEFLSRGLERAISIAQSSPTTKKILKDRVTTLIKAAETARSLEDDYGTKRQDVISKEHHSKLLQAQLSTLKTWQNYCEVEAPALSQSLEKAKAVVSNTRIALAGLPIDESLEVPAGYSLLTLSHAIQVAKESVTLAEQQVKSGVESLQQQERLGQSLVALQSDLRNIVLNIISRTGDSSQCPVCRTAHADGSLIHKVESLDTSENTAATDGLRQAVHSARDRVQREKNALDTLQKLQRFAELNNFSTTTSVDVLIQNWSLKRHEFSDALAEVTRLESFAESLDLVGADWSKYATARDSALNLIDKSENFTDLNVVKARVAATQMEFDATNKHISEAREKMAALTKDAINVATTAGLPYIEAPSPKEVVGALQRSAGLLDNAMAFFKEAAKLITIRDDQQLETLQKSIDEAISAFDRALHAERMELSARSEQNARTNELQEATEQLRLTMARQENLTRAIEVLDKVVNEYSLDKATQEALDSIRSHVSEIFARIHSPAEYVIGGFDGEQLLTTRDGLRAHGVSQVSTGQRAALALSIFLALNRSAQTVPPVLLIDDPVAHIDDLNALSFLDYLRDLTVSTRKQIFFATADAKLAALFQRKFEFLGNERFKKIVLPR